MTPSEMHAACFAPRDAGALDLNIIPDWAPVGIGAGLGGLLGYKAFGILGAVAGAMGGVFIARQVRSE